MASYLDQVADVIKKARDDYLLNSNINISYFVEYVKLCLAAKDGYIMGSYGQDPKKLSDWYFNQYSGSQKTKALYWKENCERVHDCQGMVEGFLTRVLGKTINVYARTNYANWCNPKDAISSSSKVPSQYRVPGAAVFIHSTSAGHITHVGYLIEPVSKTKPEGDWYVIEARGVNYGVVRTKLNSRGWNRVGLMTKYFRYDNVDTTTIPIPDINEFGSRTLKKGMSGKDVQELQSILIDLGYDVGKYGADGDFGSCTDSAVKAFQSANKLSADGVVGQKTYDKIREKMNKSVVSTPDKPRKYIVEMTSGSSVYIRSMSGAIKGSIHLGDILPYTGKVTQIPSISSSDFYVVEYLDDIAVVSSKYTTIKEIV